MVDHVIAIDRCVNRGESLQRFGRCLNKEAHEAQACAIVGLLELLFVGLTQVHQRLHIDFVKSRQHG